VVGLPQVTTPRPKSILLLEDDLVLSEVFALALTNAGYAVDTVTNGREGLAFLDQSIPDLIISDIMMPEMDGLEFLTKIREHPSLRFVPVILLTTKSALQDVVKGFELGADDYLAKPVDLQELLVRVESKILRPPVPLDAIRQNRQTGLLNEAGFLQSLETELSRARRNGYACTLVKIRVYELGHIREMFGHRAESALALAIGKILQGWALPDEVLGAGEDGTYMVLVPDAEAEELAARLNALMRMIVRTRFEVDEETLRVTPLCGYADVSDGENARLLRERARIALAHAMAHLDLRPIRFEPSMAEAPQPRRGLLARIRAFVEPLRFPVQIASTYVLGWAVPFGLLVLAYNWGFDISYYIYIGLVVLLLSTAVYLWIEGFTALRRKDPPELEDEKYGPVSAIIAAYLPNEAPTIESTIAAFLRIDYPATTQIILAYNTPFDMPIEDRLREIAARDPRFSVLRVEGSTSKAQNVNAALSVVTSPVTAIYDADHQPDPDSFRRAWRWIASGADVVQGHCYIRNGAASWVARMVAVEFELIYGVSHPGRARIHGYGIFGGTNGFWRTDLLREIRMRGSMLTEDIDSSVRAVAAGHRIVSDPYLVSRELAPTTLGGLTNQRLRWAQGWYQVALKRLIPAMFSRKMSARQKFGMLNLLGWREVFPWVSMLMVPVIGFWMWREGSIYAIDWLVPLLLVITLFIFVTGPGQLIFAWMQADKQMRKHPGWFWNYLFMSVLFYSGYKNIIARVANIKEALGERVWRVTPRQ
jgi:cellulose synthase/poly-beta-1,6-N-acetylglucosamine synthase-like glycosyltransferase/CheY-like chemotaxis protein/GGDEF domain-containing protein